MMKLELSAEQGRALAALVAALRQDWDEAGILAALRDAKTRGTPLEVSIAAIKAAGTLTNRTPAVIALEGAHWAGTSSASAAPRPRCPMEGHEYYRLPCAACKADELASLPGAVDVADPPALSDEQRARNRAGAHEALAHMAPRPHDPRELAAGEGNGEGTETDE